MVYDNALYKKSTRCLVEVFLHRKGRCLKVSELRKKPSYFPLYWLFNTDPGILIMAYYNALYNWVGTFIPYITQPTKVFLIAQIISLQFQVGYSFNGLEPKRPMDFSRDLPHPQFQGTIILMVFDL